MFKTQGKKEIKEAVIIAGLIAAVTGLIELGIDILKDRAVNPKDKDKDK